MRKSALALAVVCVSLIPGSDALAGKNKKPPSPPALEGQSYEYDYDGADKGRAELAWYGRAFVHKKAAEAKGPLPLLVFIHGLNSEKIKYRWFGGGNEGDVRRIVAGLIEEGKVRPMLVAAPSTIHPKAAFNALTSWPDFDLDAFLDKTEERLKGIASIDRSKIIVAGHSGAGCNAKGGLVTALKAKAPLLAALVIDTCMGTDLASELAHMRSSMNIVVSWQTMSWTKRPLSDFQRVFKREVEKTPASAGVLRELEHERPKGGMAHDAMVPLTLGKWLPKLLPPEGAKSGE